MRVCTYSSLAPRIPLPLSFPPCPSFSKCLFSSLSSLHPSLATAYSSPPSFVSLPLPPSSSIPQFYPCSSLPPLIFVCFPPSLPPRSPTHLPRSLPPAYPPSPTLRVPPSFAFFPLLGLVPHLPSISLSACHPPRLPPSSPSSSLSPSSLLLPPSACLASSHLPPHPRL
ncbi:hypothetical protein B0H14DRAFT_2835554, partial [Mycena olivaceomarginata]